MADIRAAKARMTTQGTKVTIELELSPLLESAGASLTRAYRDALQEAVDRRELTRAQCSAIIRRAKELLLERGVENPTNG